MAQIYFDYTATCRECGETFGPTAKVAIDDEVRYHRRRHAEQRHGQAEEVTS